MTGKFKKMAPKKWQKQFFSAIKLLKEIKMPENDFL